MPFNNVCTHEEIDNMKVAMTKIAAAVALVVVGSNAYAIDEAPNGGIGTVVDFNVTGGHFGLGDPNKPITFGALGWDMVDAGGATGNLANAFLFFGQPVAIFTNTPALGDGTPNGGAEVNAGAYPAGTTTASTITMDLSSWTNFWNGTNFNTGSSNVVGTYDSTTGAFSMGWSATVVGGPFSGQVAHWDIQGFAAAAPVPEAETYAMMLAGLGLVGTMVARRRKLVA